MDVFSKSYLEEVVENQGKLFEYAHGSLSWRWTLKIL